MVKQRSYDDLNKHRVSDIYRVWDWNVTTYKVLQRYVSWVGYELGIFDVLKDAGKPLTSKDIADLGGLKERYVREWLGAVTAAEVVTVHRDNNDSNSEVNTAVCRYSLSQEHYKIIVASVSLGRGLCACVKRLDFTMSCFKKEGPSGDARAFEGEFKHFFGEFRNQESATIHRKVFPYIQSFTSLHEAFDNGCNVLDIGCGTGTHTLEFAKRYPNSMFTGLEVSEDVLLEATAKLDAARNDFHNVLFKLGRPDCLFADIDEASFDVAMLFQVLHNLPDPLKMIEDVNRILKPGGRLILLEVTNHSSHADNVGSMDASMMYTLSQFYCLPFSLSDKPYEGYGAGWGEENMLKALDKYFTLDLKNVLTNVVDGIYILTKY